MQVQLSEIVKVFRLMAKKGDVSIFHNGSSKFWEITLTPEGIYGPSAQVQRYVSSYTGEASYYCYIGGIADRQEVTAEIFLKYVRNF